jgi:hypothetical protein
LLPSSQARYTPRGRGQETGKSLGKGPAAAVRIVTEEAAHQQAQADGITKARQIGWMAPVATVDAGRSRATVRTADPCLGAREKIDDCLVLTYLYLVNLELKSTGKQSLVKHELKASVNQRLSIISPTPLAGSRKLRENHFLVVKTSVRR